MAPGRSLSPDWCRDGVSPNTAPTALEFLKRAGTSMVTRKVSATTGPTPGIVIRRRHTASSRTTASKRRCRISSCSRSTGRTMRRGSTNTVKSGRFSSLAGPRFSSESAPGPFQYGIRGRGGPILLAELPSDERQVQADARSHLIHRPARDIIPPYGGIQVSPIAFVYRWLSCRCDFLGPPELGAINPYAVHDDCQSTGQRHDCLFHPAVL